MRACAPVLFDGEGHQGGAHVGHFGELVGDGAETLHCAITICDDGVLHVDVLVDGETLIRANGRAERP